MTYLDTRTAVSVVEQALVGALSLALLARHAEVEDVRALAGIASLAGGTNAIPPGALRYVQTEGVVYRWMPLSANTEVLSPVPYVIKPSDRSTSSRGRWERQESTVTKGPNHYLPVHRVREGYAKAVQLWQGDEGEEQARERIFGQSPAILVRWMGDDLVAKAQPRALYDVGMRFEIWCFARNLRPLWEALRGDELSGDADEPGLWRMMGDARYVLAGSDLGLSPGVRYLDIQGQGEIVHEDLAERKFIGVLDVLVRAAYAIPDEDLVPLSEVWAQFKDAGLAITTDGTYDEAPDLSNYIAQGYKIPIPVSGLSGQPAAGVAYVDGTLVSSAPPPHLFSASKDTYRYLHKDGLLSYLEVDLYGDRPQTPSGTLLVGCTQTDATDIVADTILCGYLVDSGEPFQVL